MASPSITPGIPTHVLIGHTCAHFNINGWVSSLIFTKEVKLLQEFWACREI